MSKKASWNCPDCGEKNEKDICQLCGRVRRGDEKTEPRWPDPKDAQVSAFEKTPASEKAQSPNKVDFVKIGKKRSDIIYFDKDDNITTKENAVRAIIQEYNWRGKVVNTIWGTISQEELYTDETLDRMLDALDEKTMQR